MHLSPFPESLRTPPPSKRRQHHLSHAELPPEKITTNNSKRPLQNQKSRERKSSRSRIKRKSEVRVGRASHPPPRRKKASGLQQLVDLRLQGGDHLSRFRVSVPAPPRRNGRQEAQGVQTGERVVGQALEALRVDGLGVEQTRLRCR